MTGQDKAKDACGVFGIFAPGREASRVTYFGLYALQHRGQESAGIATSDGDQFRFYKAMGLVSQVFTEDILRQLGGNIACGHTRYSTTGGSRPENAQPIFADSPLLGRVFVCHNGNLTNADLLKTQLTETGHEFHSTTDSEVIAVLIASSPGTSWEEKIKNALPRLIGSFSLVVMTRTKLIGVRDGLGNRPLCLGNIDGGWVIASESCALDIVGAELVREVEAGEMITIDLEGIHSSRVLPVRNAFCVFEHIYLARPDSIIEGALVHQNRWQMGRQLAYEHPALADIVLGVPLGAIPVAQGFAEASGIPYRDGIAHNRYITRTFIQPHQRMRVESATMKYNPMPELISGKRVVVVDDSIVRGTSQKALVKMLKRAGAREIHLRICAPPLRHPCYLGVDMATYDELIAHRTPSVQEIAKELGVDSLGYLSLKGVYRSIGLDPNLFCAACFTGDYPVPAQLSLERFAPSFTLGGN